MLFTITTQFARRSDATSLFSTDARSSNQEELRSFFDSLKAAVFAMPKVLWSLFTGVPECKRWAN